jgi:hypothetical protein
MNNDQIKQLCLSLMKADTEDEVITILKKVGYWEDHSVWRFYGDIENNYSTIGNQQARPDAALIEKLVNSVDARLMNECLIRGVDPTSPSAPQSIQEAVAAFFEDSKLKSVRAGLIKEWGDEKRREIARGITLTATGATAREGNPCFTISDCGEGQTPEMMPNTLLSLVRENKLRIPFVQGKFNMGGTGALKFCGQNGLQLIVSRRNLKILKLRKLDHPSDMQWGFTIVRREPPEGGRRSSVYTYLAPIGAKDAPGKGGVLRFEAESMPIFPSVYPEKPEPYGRLSPWGTLIKLYEYATGFKGQIPLTGSVKEPVDLLLPEVALPIRIHECRKKFWKPGSKAASFETTITGLRVRLDDDKAENLEEYFPSSSSITVNGEKMNATIFAFKKGTARRYRKSEGIIFTVNGQTHAHLSTDFFRRKNVKLSYLADSLLVMIDCSDISGKTREDLFMNSRDRLSGGELRTNLEYELEEMLKNHTGLKELQERRRLEAIEDKISEDKPLENILKSLIKHSPTLTNLFLLGQRASNPFKSIKVKSDLKFVGKPYPTYFRFKGLDQGKVLYRDCHINMRCRITFETDATNDYFTRDIDPGEHSLYIIKGELDFPIDNYNMNLWNGLAHLNVKLLDNCNVGDDLHFVLTVTDSTKINPFINTFVIKVKPSTIVKSHSVSKERAKPPSKEEGVDREIPGGIQLPNIIEVYENEWEKQEPPFNKTSALRIKNAGVSETNGTEENGGDIYDFFVNMDNVYLKTELKLGLKDARLVRERFRCGLVLLGMALLQQEMQKPKKPTDEEGEVNDDAKNGDVEKKVEEFSSAVAPILLPLIDSLGDLNVNEGYTSDTSGEET